jgi:SSS family solute:Na+ symporter
LNFHLIWILAYSVLLIGLGAWFSRRVRLASEFLVARRKLGPVLIFATFLAANIGAGSTVGAAAFGYRAGWSAWWWVGAAGLGCLILANTVGPRLWYWARVENFATLGDYLEYRYSRSVRGWVAIILWGGTVGLLAAQLIAISIILNIVAGLPLWQGCALGGIVVVSYYAAGGLLSSAWINLLQLVILLAGFILALPYALEACGGWDSVASQISLQRGASHDSYFSPFGFGIAGVLYYVSLLTPSFIVSPGLVQKIYGARSASAVRAGVNLNGIALLLFAAIPPALGMIAAARFPHLADPQLALPKVMFELLPTWLGILGLAAIFSAEVSTCDAVLFMLSSSLAVDLYRTFFNPGASEQVLLRASRVAAVAGGALGVVVAIAVPSILDVLTFFYSLVSVALFIPVVVGVYSRLPDAVAAQTAILVSVIATLVLYKTAGDRLLGFLNPSLIGIMISFVVLWGVTLFRIRK